MWGCRGRNSNLCGFGGKGVRMAGPDLGEIGAGWSEELVHAPIVLVKTSPHPAGLPPLLSLQLSLVWGDAKGTACSNPLCRPQLSRPPTLSQSSEVAVSQL